MGRRPGHGGAFTDSGLRLARHRHGNGFLLSLGKVEHIWSCGDMAAAGQVAAGQPPAAITSPRPSLAAAEDPPWLPGPSARWLTGRAHGWGLKSPPPGGAEPTWEPPGESVCSMCSAYLEGRESGPETQLTFTHSSVMGGESRRPQDPRARLYPDGPGTVQTPPCTARRGLGLPSTARELLDS